MAGNSSSGVRGRGSPVKGGVVGGGGGGQGMQDDGAGVAARPGMDQQPQAPFKRKDKRGMKKKR